MPEASGSGVADESDYSTFENKTGLAEDMKFLASMPELCDVTFLVGDTREPVCAVKAVLAARSRVFHKMLYQAPSPQRKKEPPPRENKIRLFLKRSSEPLLNLQNAAQQRSGFTQQLAPIQEPNQHHTLIIEEFEPDVFRQLIEYIHTGCVTLQPRTLLGVMNAADYYGLDELRRACAGFVQCCITVDTVCALLSSAERYIQYKCTKSLVQKVLEFVDVHGQEVLNLGSFTLLPQHVVRLILAREELRADELTKFQAALMWSKKYCDSNQNTQLKDVIGTFLEYIQFHKIPANELMREVHPLDLVPSRTIVNALAYQADPNSIDPGKLSPHRVRRQGRSMSVQSSLDPYGSNTTLSSSGSDVGSDQKQHSGKNGIAEQESPREQQQRQQRMQRQRDEEDKQRQRVEEDMQRHREEADLQRQIEQRYHLQLQRQEQELRQQQEEDSKKQQLEDSKRQQQDEDSMKQQLVQNSIKQQQVNDSTKQQQEKDSTEQQKEKDSKEQRQECELKKQEDTEKKTQGQQTDRKQQEQQTDQEQQKQQTDQKQQEQQTDQKQQEQQTDQKQQEQQTDRKQQEQQTDQKQQEQQTDQKEQEQQETQDELQRRTEKEQVEEQKQQLPRKEEPKKKKVHEDRQLRLHLEEVNYFTVQRQLMLQRQEEFLDLQIEEKRHEEQNESRQLHQLQLYLEGRKPEEKPPEQPQRQPEQRKAKRAKKHRVEVRVREPEAQKQEQDQQNGASEGVGGLYIRLVVRQEGRANLVWLLKTHKF